LKITYKSDYALKAVLELAIKYKKEVLTNHELAKRIDAPIKYLEQVLVELKKGGFIESRRGNVGGYLLSMDPAKITVGDIVRAIEGPIEPIACVEQGYTRCADSGCCVFRNIWQQVHRATTDIIDRVTFEELAAQVLNRQQAIAYSI